MVTDCGTVPPVAKGDPVTWVRTPVLASIAYAETLCD